MPLDRSGLIVRRTKPRLKMPEFLEHVGRAVEWEQAHRPKARTAGDVPFAVEAITQEWLTAVLCGIVPGAAVADFTIVPASTGTSERHRIMVGYNAAGIAAGLPQHLFSKSTPNLSTRVINGFTGTTEPQAEFYLQIRPELDIEAPVAFHASYDSDNFRSIILFDDLTVSNGATFCDWHTRLTREGAEDILTMLATVSGKYYGDPRLDTRFNWLIPMVDWYVPLHEGFAFDTVFEQAIDEAAHVIPGEFLQRRERYWSALHRSVALHDEHPRTIIHNDSHLGNVYVTGAGKASLCDWQCVCSGLWARDFAYAVSAMLPVEDRRLWERDLLALYVDRLNEAAGRRIATPEEAWNLYRQQIALALAMWLPTLHPPDGTPDMQPAALSLEMIHRMTTAMIDVGSFDA